MAPTVILLRHAQGLHNAKKDYSIPDPPLSDFGLQECVELQNHFQKHLDISHHIELIVVSPMRRTLQTAQTALEWLIKRGVQVQPRGEWQENSNAPCDTGTPVTQLAKDFPSIQFDTVFPEYPSKTGRWAYTPEAIAQRGSDCRRWLKARPEKVIAVVSHSSFLRIGVSNTKFHTADYRVFGFGDEGDQLVEWDLTVENEGGLGKSRRGKSYAAASDFEHAWVYEQTEDSKADG